MNAPGTSENTPQPDGGRPKQTMTPVYLRPHRSALSAMSPKIETPDQPPATSWRQPASEIVREIVETLLLTLLIFWLVNAVIGRNRIEGPSMQPNFWTGEYLISSKTSYYLDDPQRGDVIVFRHPNNSGTNLIKRVIGLPGDTVLVRDQKVYVNGTLLDEPYINSPPAYSGEWHVPTDSFFVLGDNRNNSSDSHNWNFVPRDNIIGKAMAVLWPPDKWGYVTHFRYGERSASGEPPTSMSLPAPATSR
ncbi:MAG: signal peptidase I [Anaerolineae bacterium]|nr:signal peptidase I [Anaerolineae bacterium]